MRERVTWTAAETEPDRAQVLELQGLPARAAPPPRIAALYEAALSVYLETAEPRGILGRISREAFAEVYRGVGRNAVATPLEQILPRADHLALFVATVGDRVSAKIRALFTDNEPAQGAMLDSVASVAADRLADLLGPRLLAAFGDGAGGDLPVLAYSPGYCGWHVSGQRALFEWLAPWEIGVTLNASCLMEPLKSVSGVLVAAPREVHRFAPTYPFCADCRDKPCRSRIAALVGM